MTKILEEQILCKRMRRLQARIENCLITVRGSYDSIVFSTVAFIFVLVICSINTITHK